MSANCFFDSAYLDSEVMSHGICLKLVCILKVTYAVDRSWVK